MRTPIPPLCILCEHFIPGHQTEDGEPGCTQFPNFPVPTEIWESEVAHFEPLWGEAQGFKPYEGVTDADVEEWKGWFDEYHRLQRESGLDVPDEDGYPLPGGEDMPEPPGADPLDMTQAEPMRPADELDDESDLVL